MCTGWKLPSGFWSKATKKFWILHWKAAFKASAASTPASGHIFICPPRRTGRVPQRIEDNGRPFHLLPQTQKGSLRCPLLRHPASGVNTAGLLTALSSVLEVPRHAIIRICKKETAFAVSFLCWHYLSSRAVTRKVLSALVSLTSVFGMGTGGPSQQSIPTLQMALHHPISLKTFRLLTPLF